METIYIVLYATDSPKGQTPVNQAARVCTLMDDTFQGRERLTHK